ncbi:MFS general substrate transporter [Hypoxylon fragiforme]|uniref:MFS general substrate transporter n=1 Tax=Hypoxylon fragiforme TaxID=63214 RepID=UPI0020C70666|nr:MFS general substrate transporter [Hypoxylon fragiforme]KAI2607155.1 MFS general substrate transporter [Hypoxylon fragiforme]
MAIPESTEPAAPEISQIIDPGRLAPPKPPINNRKTLPPLPPPKSPLPRIPESGEKSAGTSNTDREPSISSAIESILTSLNDDEKYDKLLLKLPEEPEERPPRPVSKDWPRSRPTTSATTATTATTATASSFSSTLSKRTIKYGTGRYANVELSPQPSEDPEDPLNWPLWKKHLNSVALLSMVSLIGVMKTAYISVNSVIAIEEDSSYTAAVALTAVPLMVSAATGLASMILARMYGKRPLYLVSMVAILIGVAWNTRVRGDLGQNMAARVFQGLGWGAFDTLVLGSIQDTYFEHERQPIIIIHHAVSVAMMLGAPLLGGVVSTGARGYEAQFEILSAFLAISMLLLVFGAPETTYDRPATSDEGPPTMARSQSTWPKVTLTKEAVLAYMTKMKPWSYRVNKINLLLILQAPRAMFAPTTGLLFVITLLPYAGFWSLASSLSLIFSPLPFMLSTDSLGAIMAAAFILGPPVAVALALPLFQRRFTPTVHVVTLIVGTAFASMGTLGFGLYVAGMPSAGATLWDLGPSRVSIPVASFLLGLLALGSLALDATVQPVVHRSTAFISANLTVGLRNTADMHGGLACLRSLFAGVFIQSIPNAISEWNGLKMTATGLGVAQICVAVLACAVYWYWDENVRRLDGRAMGLIDLSILRRMGSFFEGDGE